MTQSGLATSLRMCTKSLISARILYAERCPNWILPRCLYFYNLRNYGLTRAPDFEVTVPKKQSL